MDAAFTSFTDEASMPTRPQTHVERTYDRRYVVDHGAPRHDYWACAHPNGVCVVGVCATHSLFDKVANSGMDQPAELQIVFSKVKGQDLLSVKSNGKKMSKRDGTWVNHDTVICSITVGCDQGQDSPAIFECLAGVEGKLLQVNSKLQEHPQLLLQRPHDDGHLFIACLCPRQRKHLLETWLTLDSYCAARTVSVDAMKGGFVAQP